MRRHHDQQHRQVDAERGSVALIFALCVLGIFGSVALAIDYGRAHSASTKVRSALDAAALAGAKLLNEDNLNDNELKTRAKSYFDAHVSQLSLSGVTLTDFDAVPNQGASTVKTSVKVAVNTAFAKLIGVEKVNMEPSSTVRFRMKNIEISLVLDITGSMCDPVPYFVDPPCTSGPKLDAVKAAANELVETLKSSAVYAGAIKVSVVPWHSSVNADIYASQASGGASTDNCVVERSGGSAYNNDAPGNGRYVGTASSPAFPAYTCPQAKFIPLQDLSVQAQYNAVKSTINGLSGLGSTAGHIGIAWGWYAVSPEWNSVWSSDHAAKSYDPDKTIKAVIVMTDGIFNSAYKNGAETMTYGDAETKDRTKPGTSGYQALKLCKNMVSPADDSKRINVYTIAFQAPADAFELLKECSGTSNAYLAADAGSLTKAFASIANRLTKLSIAK